MWKNPVLSAKGQSVGLSFFCGDWQRIIPAFQTEPEFLSSGSRTCINMISKKHRLQHDGET